MNGRCVTNSAIIKNAQAINKARTCVCRVEPAKEHFSSRRELLSYVRQKCTSGLNMQQPHEYAVVTDIKQNKVLFEYLGDSDKCALDDLSKMNIDVDNTVIFHGHPDGFPISPPDILFLLKTKISQVIAFDSQGNFSLIARTNKTPKNYEKKYMQYSLDTYDLFYETKNSDKNLLIGAVDSLIRRYTPGLGLKYVSNFLNIKR